MVAAPELSPGLDDALRAVDGALAVGVMDRRQLATIRVFLESLHELKKGPRMVIDAKVLSILLETATIAGARYVDNDGQVLAMRVPVFVELLMAAQEAERSASFWQRLKRIF